MDDIRIQISRSFNFFDSFLQMPVTNFIIWVEVLAIYSGSTI
jgi:hypothetical protein